MEEILTVPEPLPPQESEICAANIAYVAMMVDVELPAQESEE